MAKIYKRGATYWARVQREGTEHRVSLKTKDRRVAERRFRQWLDDMDATAWGEIISHTFNEAAERFAAEHAKHLKPASRKRYQISLNWLVEFFDQKPLASIGRATMTEFEAWRRTHGASAPTIRRDFACLSSLLTSCEDWEWIKEGGNPVPAFLRQRRKRGLKEAPPRTRYLTDAEEAALLAHASPSVALGVRLAIDTGLRREELFSLEWSQVDLTRGFIRTTTATKSGRARLVPLGASAQYLAQHPRRLGSPFVLNHQDSGDRFVSFEKGFKAACRRAGLHDVRWHDLRRTAGCRWLQVHGKTLAEVCLLLGHSSVQVTESRYAFLNEEAAALVERRPIVGTRDSGVA